MFWGIEKGCIGNNWINTVSATNILTDQPFAIWNLKFERPYYVRVMWVRFT